MQAIDTYIGVVRLHRLQAGSYKETSGASEILALDQSKLASASRVTIPIFPCGVFFQFCSVHSVAFWPDLVPRKFPRRRSPCRRPRLSIRLRCRRLR